MKTVSKLLISVAILGAMAVGVAAAADQAAPQTWTPGWRHEQMLKAVQDGTVTPGTGPGFGRGMGPGMRGGMMAAAIGPDGKVDPAKLPEFCPMRQALTTK